MVSLICEALAAFGEGCYEGTEATKKMKPKAGRSCYSVSDAVFEFTSENPDPGALAVYIISREISKAFNDL